MQLIMNSQVVDINSYHEQTINGDYILTCKTNKDDPIDIKVIDNNAVKMFQDVGPDTYLEVQLKVHRNIRHQEQQKNVFIKGEDLIK